VLKAGQERDGLAKTITVTGLAEAPRVTLNGKPVEVQSAINAAINGTINATGRDFHISLAGS
jgi:hypothetical protein